VHTFQVDLFRKPCVFNNTGLTTNFTSDKNTWVEWKEEKKCSTGIQVCQGTDKAGNILVYMYNTWKYIMWMKFRKIMARCLIKRSLHNGEASNRYLTLTDRACKEAQDVVTTHLIRILTS